MNKDNKNGTIVEGETPPQYGLVVNNEHEPRSFSSIEEAEIEIKRRNRLDQRIEIYDGHIRKIVPRPIKK